MPSILQLLKLIEEEEGRPWVKYLKRDGIVAEFQLDLGLALIEYGISRLDWCPNIVDLKYKSKKERLTLYLVPATNTSSAKMYSLQVLHTSNHLECQGSE